MSISPFEHPYLSGLLGDQEIAGLFSMEAEIAAMLSFEAALARAEAGLGIIPAAAAGTITRTCAAFTPDVEALCRATRRDGVVIPEFIRQLREATDKDSSKFVHFGSTSQDVIDTGLILRLKQVCSILLARLAALDSAFASLAEQFGANSLMGRTRMQAAIPVTAAARISAWRGPLSRHIRRLADFAASDLVLQFGGAAGTLEKFPGKADALRAALARELDLADAPQWQSQRDRLADFASILSLITGTLGKFGQDVALMAQQGGEITLSGGGGSSAMPHKQNPVTAETLVTLARFNATQLSSMHHALVHEQERSGAAWMLEWLTLPPMVVATGSALLLAQELTGNIRALGQN